MDQALRVMVKDTLSTKHGTELMILLQKYIKESGDRSATPEQAWEVIKKKVGDGDISTLVILYIPVKSVEGFMYCKIKDGGRTAEISGAYLPPKNNNKLIISDALDMFERWARHMEARTAVFHTFRSPGAHKFMMRRGFHHRLTTYSKEL